MSYKPSDEIASAVEKLQLNAPAAAPAPEPARAASNAPDATIAITNPPSNEIASAPDHIQPATGTAPAPTATPAASTTPDVPVNPSAQGAAKPSYPPLPAYALTYSPLLWLHSDEHYWPGDPLQHLGRCMPQTKDGKPIHVPDALIGKTELLELPEVDKADVFLVLAQDNPRINAKIEDLMSTKGKPDPKTRRSTSPVWIIAVDKSHLCGPGIMDIFYFYFYPYNLGNTVAFTEFGNHVGMYLDSTNSKIVQMRLDISIGDWEHTMVRFKDGQPIAVHFSAHADGHSWAWKTVEKMEGRPVAYVATGSHAMYGKNGSHDYSGVPIVGPIDYTNKGVLWDPVLNYTAASYDISTETFAPLSAADPTATMTAAPPQPGPGATITPSPSTIVPFTVAPSVPAFNTDYTPKQVVTILTYRGRWGNSFSDVRKDRNAEGGLHKFAGDALAFMKGSDPKHERHSLGQKVAMLRWAEGPSGPRWKSLERKGATWNTEALLEKLL
ncbi:Vacuolar protein sorting-associated protein 62 [Tulasnella sp. JGI-2019a]|nr:Vacuolar protein sorting-associated protein 62 [Tulasnella sp. JGI-2019a]